MADDEEVPERFQRIADRAGALVTPRMLYGDTSGGWFSDAPVYPPVGVVLERDETPVHVIPLLEDDSKKAAAFVPTDRRLYLVRGIRGHNGQRTSTTTIPFDSIQQIRTLGEEATTGVKLMLDGSNGRAAVPSDEGSIPSELSIGLHDDADPGEAARAVSYVMEQRDGVTEQSSNDHTATANTGEDTVENDAAADSGGEVVERLSELASLRERGAITDEEFTALKQEVLGGDDTPSETTAKATDQGDADEEAESSFTPSIPAELTRYQSFYRRLGLPEGIPLDGKEDVVEAAYRYGCEQVSSPDQQRLLEEAYETLVNSEQRERYEEMEHLDYLRSEGYSK